MRNRRSIGGRQSSFVMEPFVSQILEVTKGKVHGRCFQKVADPRSGGGAWRRCGVILGTRGMLLFLGEECRHLAAGPKGFHHLGSSQEDRIIHRATEV